MIVYNRIVFRYTFNRLVVKQVPEVLELLTLAKCHQLPQGHGGLSDKLVAVARI